MKLAFSLLLVLCCGFASACHGQEQESIEIRQAKARALMDQAQTDFDTGQRLIETGSLSQRRLRDLRYRLDKATVELAILSDAERVVENQLLSAKLTAQYATETRELFEQLEKKDGKSRFDLKRAIIREEIANLKVQYYENHNDATAQKTIAFKIAAAKVRHATEEFETIERLYLRGSISKLQLERSENALNAALNELDVHEKALGASAEVIN